MYNNKTELTVRYAETDKMGVVYHANYLHYFEIGRTESLRSLGFSYRNLEENDIILPVTNLEMSFKTPLFYDDKFIVETTVFELPSYTISFKYKIFRDDQLICFGKTKLVFINNVSGKPMKCPDNIIEKLTPYFTK